MSCYGLVVPLDKQKIDVKWVALSEEDRKELILVASGKQNEKNLCVLYAKIIFSVA